MSEMLKADSLERGNYRRLKLTDQIQEVQDGCVNTNTVFMLRQLQEKYLARKKKLLYLCRFGESI